MLGRRGVLSYPLNLWGEKGKKYFRAEFRGATEFNPGYEPKCANVDSNKVLSNSVCSEQRSSIMERKLPKARHDIREALDRRVLDTESDSSSAWIAINPIWQGSRTRCQEPSDSMNSPGLPEIGTFCSRIDNSNFPVQY